MIALADQITAAAAYMAQHYVTSAQKRYAEPKIGPGDAAMELHSLMPARACSTKELAAMIGKSKDTTRKRLDTLVEYGYAEFVGVRNCKGGSEKWWRKA